VSGIGTYFPKYGVLKEREPSYLALDYSQTQGTLGSVIIGRDFRMLEEIPPLMGLVHQGFQP
jgi:hypothetical protein